MTVSASVRAAALPLKDAEELIGSVETFIFDCDGVIWRGDKLIDGVPETLNMLREKGKRLIFVTNNSTKSRKQCGKKFETLGLNVNEIFASSFAAAAYLKSIEFPKDKKVYVIGEDGILKELELAGFQHLGGPEDVEKKIGLTPGFYIKHDENVGAVIVGLDRYVNYYKIQYGTLCIRENPGRLFIATNCDAVAHLTDDHERAGGGSMVGAIRGSTQREPLVVGKPSTFMMDYVTNNLKMAEEPKVVTENAKIDLFEDDDEFEEFEVEDWDDDKEQSKEVIQQWEDDWDDDDVNDDFSLQLRRELENNSEKK